MSFSAHCILREFAEASRYGRTNHTERVAWWWDARWWHEIGFQSLRPIYTVEAIPSQIVSCPECGAPCEVRQGDPGRRHHPGTYGGTCKRGIHE